MESTDKIVKGDAVIIKDNLAQRMRELGFHESQCRAFHEKFQKSVQPALAVWSEPEGQEWVTIDLCVEIPLECCAKWVE